MAELKAWAKTMSERYPFPSHGRALKRFVSTLPPLSEARPRIVYYVEHNPTSKPILELYDLLVRHAGAELFGSGIMGGGLVLASRPEVAFNESVIVIEFYSSKRAFKISYRHGEIDEEQSEFCSSDEVWERLRLYLGYKFGIRIEGRT